MTPPDGGEPVRVTAGDAGGPPVPRPTLTKMRWPFPIVWLVPLLALVIAGWYWRERIKDRGPEITITFTNADGVRAGDTPVAFRGIEIGRVERVGLTGDMKGAEVVVRLVKSASRFAAEGARFWIVRPEVTVGAVTNLGTVLTGPYIAAEPGTAENPSDQKRQSKFVGLDDAPPPDVPGLTVVLRGTQLMRLQADAPVYYRGVQVGRIRDTRLGSEASYVEMTVFIEHRYAPVVRRSTRFWVVAAADVKGGIFSGLQLKLGSLKELISGGVEFATEFADDPPAKEGDVFRLYEEPDKKWLEWQPRIPLAPDEKG